MGFHYSPKIIRNGLIFYVDTINSKSYPNSGTTWFDLTSSDINGTMSNSTMGSTEQGVMTLNGTSNSVTFGHDLTLEPANITVCAWVNLLDRSNRHILLTKWLGWSFEIHADGRPYFRTNGTSPGDVYALQSLVWGNWYYIVGVMDDDNNLGEVYINGVLSNSVTKTGSISYSQGTFNMPYNNAPANALGKVSIIQIYNRALTPVEIQQNYKAHFSRFI